MNQKNQNFSNQKNENFSNQKNQNFSNNQNKKNQQKEIEKKDENIVLCPLGCKKFIYIEKINSHLDSCQGDPFLIEKEKKEKLIEKEKIENEKKSKYGNYALCPMGCENYVLIKEINEHLDSECSVLHSNGTPEKKQQNFEITPKKEQNVVNQTRIISPSKVQYVSNKEIENNYQSLNSTQNISSQKNSNFSSQNNQKQENKNIKTDNIQNSKKNEKVLCPVGCGKMIEMEKINEHVDECLTLSTL